VISVELFDWWCIIIMEFSGFISSDFDFFKKKNSMEKNEYNTKREEVIRHFREYCYELQKIYHSNTGKTLLLDKDFHGLNKNKNSLVAKSSVEGVDFVNLKIQQDKNCISIKLICPPDGDPKKYEVMKQKIMTRGDVFVRFFKENKNMLIVLLRRTSKKLGDDSWIEEFRYNNNELVLGNYNNLIENMNRLQPVPDDNKKLAGMHIGMEISKGDAVRAGKVLASRSCSEIINLLDLCQKLR